MRSCSRALPRRKLNFSPPADRATLLRRAFLDLHGLPPSPQDVAEFAADRVADAFARRVDRLLASPRFGERWGRHWLDVVGYADTVGFDTDANNLILSDGKWKYRDYVIAAFNADKPYDRFLTEQLAGDELVDWRHAPHFTPEIRDDLVATGYLRTARDQTHEPESNIPLNYYGVLHDTVEMVGSSLFAPDGELRPLPFAQVRSDPAARLLPADGPVDARLQSTALEARLSLEARDQGPRDSRRLSPRKWRRSNGSTGPSTATWQPCKAAWRSLRARRSSKPAFSDGSPGARPSDGMSARFRPCTTSARPP